MTETDPPGVDDPSTTSPVTWAGLLAHWTDLAQSALVLPDDEDGERWRRAIPDAIAMHAVAMSLGELHRVAGDERAVAMDTSELLIRRHAASLHERWRGEPMPDGVSDLIADAKAAWEAALHEGLVWLADSDEWTGLHPGPAGDDLLASGFTGEWLVASPGVPMFRGAPVATVRTRDGGPPSYAVIERIERFLSTGSGSVSGPELHRPLPQAYREMDFGRGGPVRDVVRGVLSDLPAGQPLLVAVVSGGAPCPVPMAPRSRPFEGQLPVEWADDEAS